MWLMCVCLKNPDDGVHCCCIWMCVYSIAEHPTSTVQVSARFHHLGLQTHNAQRGGHRFGYSLHLAAEHRWGRSGCSELLPNILHRYPSASLLGDHRQLSHCWFVEIFASMTFYLKEPVFTAWFYLLGVLSVWHVHFICDIWSSFDRTDAMVDTPFGHLCLTAYLVVIVIGMTGWK